MVRFLAHRVLFAAILLVGFSVWETEPPKWESFDTEPPKWEAQPPVWTSLRNDQPPWWTSESPVWESIVIKPPMWDSVEAQPPRWEP